MALNLGWGYYATNIHCLDYTFYVCACLLTKYLLCIAVCIHD